MFASSSKRAFSSTSAVTDLPDSAASTSARTIGTVVRCPVERLLDRKHVRVARRLAQELHDDVEGLVGVVDDEVLLADRREAVAGMVAHALREAGVVGLEPEVVARRPDDLGDGVERQQPRQHGDPVFRHVEFLHDELPERHRHLRIELDADHRTAPPALQRALEKPHQVLGLLLDLDVAVADQPEGPRAAHDVAGKQPVDEQADHVLQRDEADAGLARIRQAEEAVEGHRQAQEPGHRLPPGRAEELQADREAEVGDERERVRRIDRQRRQHREDRLQELALEPDAVLRRQPCRAHDVDVLRRERLLQHGKRGLLLELQPVDLLEDLAELLGRRASVRAAVGDLLAHLPLEAGHAHHEELVEVGRGDRQETDALEQRMGGVLAFRRGRGG